MEIGRVKTIVQDRGFGFITPADGHGADIFFHFRQLQGLAFDELLVGREVEFVAEGNGGKPRAQVVQPIGGAS